MQEDCRLRDLCLLQVIVGAFEHDIRDSVTQNLVGFLKKFLSCCVVVVEILTHPYELSSLSGKNKCFHFFLLVFLTNKYYP